MNLVKRLKTIHLSRRRSITLAIIVVVLLVIGTVVHILASPVKGRQVPVDSSLIKSAPKATPQTPAQNLGSSYFTLALPPGYTVQAQTGTVSGQLYSQTVLKTSVDGTLILAIGVKTMPDGGLSGDSSYTFREQQQQNYQIQTKTYNDEAVSIASDVGGDGVVAFWPHGAYMATVSVSSGLSDTGGEIADEQSALAGLLGAWQWR